MCTSIQQFGASHIYLFIYLVLFCTFILHGCKFIKSDSKYIYNVTKYLFFK